VRYICSIIRTNPSRRKYWRSNCQKQIILFANFEIDKRSDSGSNFVANDGNTTGSTNRVLATDLMRVSTELGNLGYNTGAYQGFVHNSNSNKGIVKFDWNN
jgi:hypothetical protein